jgi:hypothetical protein
MLKFYQDRGCSSCFRLRREIMDTETLESVPCPVCKYPIPAPMQYGQMVKCPYCNAISRAVTQITVPTPLFVGILSFIAGVILGPAVIASTQSGAEWLAKKARERLA